ncbi:TPA: sugar ABC transporter permease [Salmonella enterica subsp. enterica serovar Vietnam]|uniref:Sugar ABC transporter permease n=1 Tax=Salmonella enterica subsp. arizonae TaxID=59203 RepID=A0A5Y2QQZ9_SALER|nr:hypothetical protein [Salmonella enterica]ECF4924845.1 sugar ABC transporter permease [Salmonella enterica subsp. arizonae]ECI9863391.1 sugar ABC transporter permease [Salmonella enterica subsp. arizonae]HAE8197506.1 sugar ABC transporter permease [Salmonella enterica subsp. indica serovar 41:b:1,7]HAU3219493.1 sugar ABC transporter permease [Salmonella enterica subsp. indica]
MRYIIFILFLYAEYSNAATSECFSKSDIVEVKEIFTSNNKDNLIELAIQSAKLEISQDSFFNNTKNVLPKMTEVSYEWGRRYASEMPLKSSGKFPDKNICVWSVTVSFPDKIRIKCDDSGIYGYFISFKKNKNNIKIYKFTSILDELSDGSLACKAANGYLFSK